MDREKEIMEQSILLMEPRFLANMDLAAKDIEQNEEKILVQLLDSFEQTFRRAIELQTRGEKRPIDKIALFCLRSGIYTGECDFLIELYDDTFYNDPVEVSGTWTPDFIMKYYKDDILYLEKEINKKVIRVQKGELMDVKMRLVADYWKMIYVYFGLNLSVILQMDSFQEMNKTDTLQILFGEMYQSCEVLYDEVEEQETDSEYLDETEEDDL